jgi:hypothetical protein
VKKTPAVEPGDIVGVPLRDGLVAVGIVLHVSTIFRNAIMIGFYGQSFKSMQSIDIASLGGRFIETPNYTSKQLITNGPWQVVANSPHLLEEAEIPELRAAYTLHYKDEMIRQLSPDELGEYTELAGQGRLSVENMLLKHLAGT